MMMAVINKSNANDIYVEENGFGGAYKHIADACAAAQSGDRILVVPRANNAYYNEGYFFYIPANCKMISAVAGQRFNFSINTFYAEGNNFISMANIEGYLETGDNCWITNCIVSSNISGGNNLHCDNDSLPNSNDEISIGSGRISGCYATWIVIQYNIPDNIIDTTFIVGNWITQGIQTVNISNYPPVKYLYVANNYIGGGFTAIDGLCPGGLGMNTIINNIFIDLQTSYSDGITISGTNNNSPTNVTIENNLFINPFTYFHTPIAVVYISQPHTSESQISYNYVNFNNSSSNYTFAYGFTPDNTNHFTSNITIDGQGHLIAGSDAINGGDPFAGYFDLDLTRNDAGMYGGSFSMSNFNTPGIGNPRVLFMTAPRTLFTTQSANISADGVSK